MRDSWRKGLEWSNKKRFLYSSVIIYILIIFNLFHPMQGEDNSILLNILKNDKLIFVNNPTNDTIILTFNFSIYNIEEIVLDGEKYIRITLPNGSNSMERGFPDIPSICQDIIIPDNAKMAVRILDSSYKEFNNIFIIPSKGGFPRNVDFKDIPYMFGDVYSKDKWFPGELAELGEPYILRDFRGLPLRVYPFQYDPVKNVLRIYNMIKLIVFSVGPGEINVFERKKPLIVN